MTIHRERAEEREGSEGTADQSPSAGGGGVGGSGKSRPGSDTAKEEASSGDGRGVPGADGETSLVKARAGVRNRESSTAPSWMGDQRVRAPARSSGKCCSRKL